MSKIDKDALVAEIGRLRNMIERSKFRSEDDKFEPYTKDGYGLALDDVLSFIDSLQQEQPEEVDLERDAVQFCFDKGLNITPYQAKTIACYFYELGKYSK